MGILHTMNLSRPLAATFALGVLSMTPVAAADPNDPAPPPPSPSTDSPDAQADALAKITLGVLGYSDSQVAVPTTVAEPPPVPIPAAVPVEEAPVAPESAPVAPEELQRPFGVRADGSNAGEPQGALARAAGLSSRSSTQGYWRASAFYSPGR